MVGAASWRSRAAIAALASVYNDPRVSDHAIPLSSTSQRNVMSWPLDFARNPGQELQKAELAVALGRPEAYRQDQPLDLAGSV